MVVGKVVLKEMLLERKLDQLKVVLMAGKMVRRLVV
jgi:hypothetical protein